MSQVFGVALIIAGIMFAAVHTKRLLSANPGTRIPWIGWPDRRPSGSTVLLVVAIVCVVGGTELLTTTDHGYIDLGQAAAIWLVGLVAFVVPVARHNRRLHH